MNRLRLLLSALRSDQRGLTTVEYAIILCLIVAITAGTWDTFGGKIKEALVRDTEIIQGTLEPTAP